MRSVSSADFDKLYIPEPNTGCWLWTGRMKVGRDERGRLRHEGKTWFAHRFAYQMFKGEIPEGLCVCHTCDVTTCVNPDHLFLGTHADNMQDCARKGRRPKTITRWGDKNPSSKLTLEQVADIKSRQFGPTFYAEKYGIHPNHASSIQSGRRRSEVQPAFVYVHPAKVQTEKQRKRAAYMRDWNKRRKSLASGDVA